VSARPEVAAARRVVLKVGSSSLTGGGAGLDLSVVERISAAALEQRAAGREVVLVSSGAIAAGLAPLGLTVRPRDLATLQAAASVGQLLLVQAWAAAFGAEGVTVAQVLLSAEDVARRVSYRNARTTLARLLELGAVPVVNENDAVATAEIRLGDNDRLAALVAHLVDADLLVLLSDVDALYDGDPRRGPARRIDAVRGPADLDGARVGGSGSVVGSGGMATKVEAARVAAGAGLAVVVGAATDVAGALRGEPVGTLFHPTGPRITSRRLWLAHASEPRGRVLLDAGAVTALRERGSSLLAVGVTGVEGAFAAGDPVELVDAGSGRPVARGLAGYAAHDLPPLLGRPGATREVVHRDDLVLL